MRAKMQRERFSFRAIPVVLETCVARPAIDEWSIPTAGICFAFELANERRGLAWPFEPLLGSQSMEFGMAVEILRLALGKCTLEFFAR
jgi:hypothetical protein